MLLTERIEALRKVAKQYNSARYLDDAIKQDNILKTEIKELYKLIFKRSVNTNCGSCLSDAVSEILHTKNIMEKIELQYELKAGALLRDTVNFDTSKLATRKNLTKELALYHLATNPKSEKYFSNLPKNWKEEVAAYKKEMELTSIDDAEAKAKKEAAKK